MKYLFSILSCLALCIAANANGYGVAVQQAPALQAAPCHNCQPMVQQRQIYQPIVQQQIVPQQQQIYQFPAAQQQFVPQQQCYQAPMVNNQIIKQQPVVVRHVVRQQFLAAPVVYSQPVFSQRAFVGHSAVFAGRGVVFRGGMFSRPRVILGF